MDLTTQLKAQISDLDSQIAQTKVLADSDPSMATLVTEELTSLEQQKAALETSLIALTDPTKLQNQTQDDNANSMESSNAILEIRAGTGGEEAKLFAEDLMRMYVRFAETKKIKIEPLDEGVVKLKGSGAFSLFKFESGVHRVQRVPVTESSGRIHTSTASVAVLPEVPPAQISIRDEDLVWKFTRAGGHGGQNVNKVNTAVMLTHSPSGIVVHCRQERYQQQNKVIALELLRSRLWEIEEEKRLSQVGGARSVIGRAMRAEKIRTYNYPENRVTDHRLPKTWKSLNTIMEGDLNPIIEALTIAQADQEKPPANSSEVD